MKLDARGLAEFLKAPGRYRAVLLYGPDGGLIRERRKLIAEKTGGKDNPLGATELTADHVAADPGTLFEALAALSLLGDAPPVILRDAGDKLSAVLAEALQGAPGNYLIVTAGELSARSSLRVLFEKDPHLAALACYADDAQTIEQVARGFFGKRGIAVEPEVFAYLRSHLGNDRSVTLSELEKIALYLGDEKTLSADLAVALVAENRSAAIDELCHAIVEKQPRQAYRLCERMLDEGHSPIALLRALGRHVERVLQLKTLLASGIPAERAMQMLRPPVFFKEKDAMRRQAGKRSSADLEAILSHVTQAELLCKRGNDQALMFERTVTTCL